MALTRTPEPKTLCPFDEAAQYHAMNLELVNQTFVEDLIAGGPVGPQVLDLGCGPAAIPILLCQRIGSLQVLAVDLEVEMLEIGKREIDVAGMLGQISLRHADICTMEDYENAIADTVICNSVLHHLDQPASAVLTAIRLLRPGGRLFFRDLCRPASLEQVETLVSLHAADESQAGQQLLRQSLLAALSLGEIENMVRGLGIDPVCVQMTSDRHWTLNWFGAS